MYFFSGFKHRIDFMRYGIDTPKEFILSYADRFCEKLAGKRLCMYLRAHRKKFINGDFYLLKDVRLPLIHNNRQEEFFFRYIFLDTFYSYMYMDDRYDEETYDYCDKFLPEGLYGLVNNKVNVTVEPRDVVIDVGSWIGDFASYAASAKKALVYAFEPSQNLFIELQKTAELNQGIIPVQKALGSNVQTSIDIAKGVDNSFSDEVFSVTTIDEFVHANNLTRVDFIKCDIEGNERHMLAGAQETLARFAPKLALCTYHLPDAPEVMAKLILQANPKYNIVQKCKKLFASVPE